MRFLLLSFFILTLGIELGLAQEEVLSFKNVREGKTYYSKSAHKRAARRTLKAMTKQEVIRLYKAALAKQDNKNLCAYDLNEELSKGLNDRSKKATIEGIVHILRAEDEIDDVVAKILLTANKVKSTAPRTPHEGRNNYLDNSENTRLQLEVIRDFEKRFAKSCFDEAYRAYFSEILKIEKKTSSTELETLHLKALETNLITPDTFLSLEQGRINELDKITLSLSSYQQKIKTLRIQYPLRDATERNDFTSTEVKKMKSSRRQKLFEQYSDLQIIMMGNVIKRFRERLEYDVVEISGYRDGELQETIPLDPMERFRFAIKILRKEMSLLTLNTYFSGRSPDYLDLMTASYEIGIISSSELQTVASMEEIWNPKKTLWEKAGMWVKLFSSVATIAIPPPYGFIPALVIVVIEATAGKSKDPNQNDPSVLF